MILGAGQREKVRGFEKNANDLNDILCNTRHGTQREKEGVACRWGVCRSFQKSPCSLYVYTLFLLCSIHRLFAINADHALSLCNLSRISASMLLESLVTVSIRT